MADKNITTVNEISSVDDRDKVFVNDGNTLKQITVINLMKKAPASSGGGTTDYNDLTNQPQLNGVTLEGNKTLDQIGAVQKNQGSGNSGKYLSVGSDGNVTLSDPPTSGGTVDPEQIKQAVNGYLEENPVSGMTAEQEEQLSANTQDITNLKSVVDDIGIGADGITYKSAGDAVREQVKALSNELKDVSQKAAGWTDSAKIALVTLIRNTAYVKNTEISDTYNTLLNELGVVPIVHATSVSLDKNNIIFDKISNTQRIVATIIPRDTTDAISWVSSNDKVATVDQKGTVTSVGEGNCEITLKVGSIVATCSVNVSVNVSVGEVYYITNELKNVSTDNNSELILKNNSYNATLTAYEGAGAISEVSVLMGEKDITSSAYSAGEISISSVTGNIVIKAKADDDYEMGYLNDMGVIQTSNSDVLSSVYTPVQKGSDIWIETYAQKETVKTFRINEYDAELNFIRRQFFQAGNEGFIQKFTVSDTTEYIRTGFGVNETASDFIDALFDGYDIYALGNIINSLDDVSYTTGGIDNSGVEVEDSNRIRSAYIPVNNNAVCFGVIVNPYTFEGSSIRVYDSSKEFLSSKKLLSFSENSKAGYNVSNANYIRLLIVTNGLDIQEDVIVYVNEKFYRLIKG